MTTPNSDDEFLEGDDFTTDSNALRFEGHHDTIFLDSDSTTDDDEMPTSPPTADKLSASAINTIAIYSGEKGTDAERFIDSVDRASKVFKWSQTETVGAAQQRMTGLASAWLKHNERLSTIFNSWDEQNEAGNKTLLKPALQERFVTGRTLAAAIGGLAELQAPQRSNESTPEFLERLSSALDKKNFDHDDAAKKKAEYKEAFKAELLKYLLHGLRDDLKRRVIGVPNAPETLNEVVAICTKAEEEILAANPVNAISTDSAAPNPQTPKEKKKVSAIQKRSDPDRFKKYPCNICNKLGHWANKCPDKKPKQKPEPQPRGQWSSFRGGQSSNFGRGGGFGNRGRAGGNRSWQNNRSGQAGFDGNQYVNFVAQNPQQQNNQILQEVQQILEQRLGPPQQQQQQQQQGEWEADWSGN